MKVHFDMSLLVFLKNILAFLERKGWIRAITFTLA